MKKETLIKVAIIVFVIEALLGISAGLMIRKAYDNGLSDGKVAGYNEGYVTGYDEGHLDGYRKGQINGYETSEDFLEYMIEFTADSGYFYKEVDGVKYKIRPEVEK